LGDTQLGPSAKISPGMLARASVARCDGRNCRTPASNRWLRPCTIDHHRRAETSQTARDPDPALWRLRLVSDGRIIEVILGASSRPRSVIAAGPFARTEGRFLAGATTKMAGGSAFWMKGLAAVLACESVASANLRMSGNPDCARDTPVCLATDRRNSGGRPLPRAAVPFVRKSRRCSKRQPCRR